MLTVQADLFYRFGAALLIGILIGVERERAADLREMRLFAGVRTISLIALAGCAGALLSDIMQSPWPLVAVIVAIGGLIIAAYMRLSGDGSTSEVAAFIALLCGALCYWQYISLAAAIAVVATVLLSFKGEMHGFVHRLSTEDIYSTLKFAAITAIILPILPDRSFGPPPFDALNPYRIWLMVVFISAISFMGYVLMKLVNVRHGIALTGLLGGLVSSTAVTLSFGRRSREQSDLSAHFAIAITIAWAIMFLRVLVQIAVINGALFAILWLPLFAAALVLAGYAAFLYLRRKDDSSEEVMIANPFELKPALTFGAIYALTLLISSAAQLYFGNVGLYVSSAFAGLADVNAVTLSMAELSSQPNGVGLEIAAESVVLAVLSNTIVRSVMVFSTGSSSLRRFMLPSVILAIVVTVAVTIWLRAT
ncbi:MAG: MgtC/SapB family protein [Caldilineaceae bacterium]|nr:MgtC/SapB family protein [Caldilineaceae bacterium]